MLTEAQIKKFEVKVKQLKNRSQEIQELAKKYNVSEFDVINILKEIEREYQIEARRSHQLKNDD